MIIRCDNLEHAYGANLALAGVSFAVGAGCTGLLGPNGAGKSTLIKLLLGQLPIPAGRALVSELDPARDPLRVRQLVGYMPEKDVTLPDLNGLELVSFCGQLSGMRRADSVSRAHEVLHFVGLGEERYREVGSYSTGMRQRTKLAAALVHGPRLLLLDEPTTGLDPRGREEMLDLVDEVAHRRRIDVLICSHILKDIERTCDNVLVLNHGQIVFSGSRQDFQHQETKILHVRMKKEKEKMAALLRAQNCQVLLRDGMGHLEVELPGDVAPELIWRVAQEHGLQIRHLAPATEGLEQAFEKAIIRHAREGES